MLERKKVSIGPHRFSRTFISKLIGLEIFQVITLALSRKQKTKLIFAVLLQVLINVLDFIGIIIFALMGSLSIQGITGTNSAVSSKYLLEILGGTELTFQQQVLILGSLASTLLVIRTLLTIWFFKNLNRSLSTISVQFISSILEGIYKSSIDKVGKFSRQELFIVLSKHAHLSIVRSLTAIIGIVVDLSLGIFIFAAVITFDLEVALITLVFFGIISFSINKLTAKKIKNLTSGELKNESLTNEKIVTLIEAFREISVNGNYISILHDLKQEKKRQVLAQTELTFMSLLNRYIYEMALILSVLGYSGLMFLLFDVATAFGAIAVFFVASSRITPTLLRIQTNFNTLRVVQQPARSTLKIINEFVRINNAEITQQNPLESINLPEISLSLEKLNYAGNGVIFNDVSFSLTKGNNYAVVGDSGVGKSTFIDLLVGLRVPNSGAILINGMQSTLSMRSQNKVFAMVPQEVHLLHGTLRENILLGRKTSSDSEVVEVLKNSMLGQFLDSLPNGLDTNLGMGSRLVSGGERQRIGIARALLSSPKILVLDEATNALDLQTTKKLLENLKSLYKEGILIVVSHDMTLVQDFDNLIQISREGIFLKALPDQSAQNALN